MRPISRKGDPPRKPGRGTPNTPVVGMVERGGSVKAMVIPKRKGALSQKKLSAIVRENIDIAQAVLMTDEYSGYFGVSKFMEHHSTDHKKAYVDGNIHTNIMESFWALLKRGIVGQYHKMSVKHLPQHIAEFCYRQNNRESVDIFGLTLSRAVGGFNA